MKQEILAFAREHDTFFAIDVARTYPSIPTEKLFSLLRGMYNEGILQRECAIDARTDNLGWRYSRPKGASA